jgi:uncharacterized protein YcaQ
VERVSVTALRRYVIAYQGYANRFRRASCDQVAQTIERLGAVQLDSISTVERAHRLTLLVRAGTYPETWVSDLLRRGVVFEYWAHEACLIPVGDYPLLRWRMQQLADRHWWGAARSAEGRVLEATVLERIREEGALPARAFEGRSEGMWGWKPAKRALEHLFAAGEVAIAGRTGFQRLYDLPERVIPAAALNSPVPSEQEFRRGFALRAVLSRGALTEAGIVEHCRLAGGVRAIRPPIDELVARGELRRVCVEDGGPAVVVPADATIDGESSACTLLSPFDNLLWDRAFVRRLFGFNHVIEVYKRPAERLYGYYVCPLLARDRLVGRADLKVDRSRGTLQVRRFTAHEPAPRRVGELLERAALRLARSLGLDSVEL